MERDLEIKFPTQNFVPKVETEATNFLTKHPEYDGRGVVIAIMDTGVDPLAPGLQVTTTGEPKIIDMIDCTGDGDVDTSTVKQCSGEKDRIIVGLTGRELKIPDAWKNPSGDWHLGVKVLHQLLPGNLAETYNKEKRNAAWNRPFIDLLAEVEKEKQLFEKQMENRPKEEESVASFTINKEKLKLADLQNTFDFLQEVDKNYTDFGPTFDCIVFNDGTSWQVCIDTSECGNLPECQLITPYKIGRQVGTIKAPFKDVLVYNYAVNVYSNGNLLSIVTCSGSHGTHVAGIATAYFPEEPERNGVAPGAQIIVLKIGDGRLSSMETQKSLIRAASQAAENKCDLANLSFGEAVKFSNKGLVIKYLTEMTNKHNVIFLSSAGNSGPGLSTVGAPASATSSVISVGALACNSMMDGDYSLLGGQERPQAGPFTWTSRGPTCDGSLGVTIAAPGGAITCVPNWTGRGTQLMNGTSMACPNACGCVALILSGLKNDGVPYTPHTVRSALENSALSTKNGDAFTFGCGIIQTEKAYQLLIKTSPEDVVSQIYFRISAPHGRGIYLRQRSEVESPSFHSVIIDPVFHENAPLHEKLQLDLRLNLISTAHWLTCPSFLNIYNQSRGIRINVDPTGLEPGAHYAEVQAYICQSKVNTEPIFRIPVTIIIPHAFTKPLVYSCNLNVEDEIVHRRFLHVPLGVSYAELTLTVTELGKESITLFGHHLQLVPNVEFSKTENFSRNILRKNTPITSYFSIYSNSTLELAFSRWWTETGKSQVTVKIQFHGITIESPLFSNANYLKEIILTNNFPSVQTIQPEIKYSKIVTSYYPTEHTISALPDHYRLPGGHLQYELQLVYAITAHQNGDMIVYVPGIDKLLYENPLGGQLWMLYNCHKKLIATGDAFSSKDGRYSAKVTKGTYTLKLQLIHDSRGPLEKLKQLAVRCGEKITEINAPVFDNYESAIIPGSPPMGKWNVKLGKVMIFASQSPNEIIPKFAKPGQFLIGTLMLMKGELYKNILCYKISQSICSLPKPEKESPGSPCKSNIPSEADLLEDMFKFQLSYKKRARGGNVTLEDLDSLKNEFKDYPPLHHAYCDFYFNVKKSSSNEDMLAVIEYSNAAICSIDIQSLSDHSAIKEDIRADASSIKIEIDKQKIILIASLTYKFRAIAKLLENGHEEYNLAELDKVYIELYKWSQPSSFVNQQISYAIAHGCYGTALKLLMKDFSSNDKESKTKCEQILEILNILGWHFISDFIQKQLLVNYPCDYLPF